MEEIYTQDIYRAVFKDYPDVMDVKQVSEILGVSTKTVYRLIREGTIQALKIGRNFKVPKVVLMKHIKILGSTAAVQTI